MAPKLGRREFLIGLGILTGSACTGFEKESLTAPVEKKDNPSIEELLANAPVEPVLGVEPQGKVYTIDFSDDFVPYPISDFGKMEFRVPDMEGYTLREDLQLKNNANAVSYWDYANNGAGHKVNVNLKRMYLDMAKGKENEKFRKYGVLPIFSDIRNQANRLSESDKDYKKKMGDIVDDIIEALDHRVYYSTFVLNDDDRKPLTAIVAKELGILNKEGKPDYNSTIDFLDKIDFENAREIGKFASKQGFRLEVPENYDSEKCKGMHIEIEVYKNEIDKDGKQVIRKKRKPLIVVYQVNGDERKELMRTRTVVGGFNVDNDDCTVNPLAPGEPIPKGWDVIGERDDGYRFIQGGCTVKEFKTPSSEDLFMYHLVVGPSWLPLDWADMKDVAMARKEVVPGYLNAFGQFMMPISDVPQQQRWAAPEKAWNIRYNTTQTYSGIAMHSTNSPDSLTKDGAGSHGCMRMNNIVANRLAAFLKTYVPARDDVELSNRGVMEVPEIGRGLGILPFKPDYAPRIKIRDGPAPTLLQD